MKSKQNSQLFKPSSLSFNEHTPIEGYLVKGKVVFVKRDDLFAPYPCCQNAKMRGVRALLGRLKVEGWCAVGVYDTRISNAGQGVTAIAGSLGMRCCCYFPAAFGRISESHRIAKELGADLIPLKSGMTSVLYARAKSHMMETGGYMLPLGLATDDSVHAVADEAAGIPQEYLGGTVVVSVGSGTIISGIASGLPQRPRTTLIIGVSCGMSNRLQFSRIRRMVIDPFALPFVQLVPPFTGYYDADETLCPWPCNPYYDRKAFRWMLGHIESLTEPVLFWNIGQ